MKKTLSLFLVLAMLSVSLVSFVGCADIGASDVESDPYTCISLASSAALDGFFADDAKLDPYTQSALTTGSVVLHVENQMLAGATGIEALDLSLFSDYLAEQYVADVGVTMGGTAMGGRFFLDPNGFALKSNFLLGSDRTLKMNFATAAATLKANEFLSAQLPAEELADLEKSFGTMAAAWAEMFEKDDEAAAFANELLALLDQSVTEEEDYVVASYAITNANIKTLMEKVAAKYAGEMSDAEKAEMQTSIDELLASLESADVRYALKYYISMEGAVLSKITFDCAVAEVVDGVRENESTLNGELAITDTKLSLHVTTAGESSEEMWAELTKVSTAEKTEYNLVVTEKEDGETTTPMTAKYTYQKATNEFTVSVTTTEAEEVSGVSIPTTSTTGIGGKVTTADGYAKIELTSLQMGSMALSDLGVSITFNKTAEVPAVPSDAKDICTLTAEEAATIFAEVEAGPFYQLLGALMGGMQA